MIQLHPRILSVSEWFTVLGERCAAEDAPADAEAFWRLLTVPTPDATELLEMHPTLPELLLSSGLEAFAASHRVPPILMVPLPHLARDPDEALLELRQHVLSERWQRLSEWHVSAFGFLARREGKRMWLERSGGSLAYVDALNRSWSDARYIHIFRDDIACAQSMYRHPYFRIRVARAVARAPLPVRECLEMNVPIEQFGAYWSAVVLRGLGILGRLAKDDVLHVSYADLIEKPAWSLCRVQHFLEGRLEAEEWVARATKLVRLPDSPAVATPPWPTDGLRRTCSIGMRALAKLHAASAS
jgi:putative sulfotransferase